MSPKLPTINTQTITDFLNLELHQISKRMEKLNISAEIVDRLNRI